MSYYHLTISERQRIEKYWKAGCSMRYIAKAIGRAPSTVKRELDRNSHYSKWNYKIDSNGNRISLNKNYSHKKADETYQKRVTRSKMDNKFNSGFLRYLLTKINQDGWSFAMVANRYNSDYPNSEFSVSAQTLYNWYHKGWFGYKLHQVIKDYNPGYMRVLKRGKTSIHYRPKEISKRLEFGHWEIDCIEGAAHKSAILTIVERKSRKAYAYKLDRKNVKSVTETLERFIAELGINNIKSITTDNGSEFEIWHHFEKVYKIPFYYCDPYASWQKGTNERWNRDFRTFYQKGFDFTKITQKDVEKVTNKINRWPRKIHNYYTASEVFNHLVGN